MAELPADRDAWLACLDFQVAAGVDLALDEKPRDWLAEAPPATAPEVAALSASAPTGFRPVRPPPSSPPGIAPVSIDVAAADARARAAGAATLEELRALLDAYDGCALKGSARQLVFADGTPGSAVMILGEAPGADEDRDGRPFVGRAGQLLDRMLAAIGLDRTGVYIANVVPWRPPGNRTPTPQEIAVCLPFTLRQIELARPRILVTLGAPATQLIAGVKDGITKSRGRWLDRTVGTLPVRVLPMLHPAYLLRTPLHKRFAWRDLQELRRELDRPVGQEPSEPPRT